MNEIPDYSLVGVLHKSPEGDMYRITGFTWHEHNEEWQVHYRLVGGPRNVSACTLPYCEFFTKFKLVS